MNTIFQYLIKTKKRSITYLIGICLGFVLLMSTKCYKIESASMYPTLVKGDIILTVKNWNNYSTISRGDIVTFELPDYIDYGNTKKKTYVKRCVAIPGDSILLKDGKLSINGKIQSRYSDSLFSNVPDPFSIKLKIPYQGDTISIKDYDSLFIKNILNEQKAKSILEKNRNSDKQLSNDKLIVENDYFFLVGDCKVGSIDSRTWGLISKNHITGEAILILYSRRLNKLDIDRSLNIL